MSEREVKCCVSGSYSKFKPENDETITELEAQGVIVLEPSKGWLQIPKTHVLENRAGFRPLPGELGKEPLQVENNFLRAIERSDFLYVDNREGYFGEMVAFEIGFALGKGKAVFMREKPSVLLDIDREMLEDVKVALPSEVRSLLSQSGE